MYDFLEAVITRQTSPEEAYRKLDEMATKQTETLRKLTKQVCEVVSVTSLSYLCLSYSSVMQIMTHTIKISLIIFEIYCDELIFVLIIGS